VSAAPIRPNPLEKKVADLARKVAELERKARVGGATTLDGLRDTEVLYDHWTDLPKLGQALRWDTTRESKFHGLASFADVEAVTFYDTWEVTTWGSFADHLGPTPAGVPMVDESWDVTRPCLVTVSQIHETSWTRMEVDPATTPPTYEDPPILLLSVYDGDTGRVTTPGAGIEMAGNRMPMTPGLGAPQTVSWLFLRGRPFVQGISFLTERASDGLTLPMTVYVVGRVTRL